jgi:hypothetical protein
MKYIRVYREIWFGFILGLAMWIIDALMHLELGVTGTGDVISEIFMPHPTTTLFRIFYMALAISFGIFLWRLNNRERQFRELEHNLIEFQRNLDLSSLRILSAIRNLRARNAVMLDETAEKLTAQIAEDIENLNELAQKYLEMNHSPENSIEISNTQKLRSTSTNKR